MTGVMYGDFPVTVNGCRRIGIRQDKAETRKLANQHGVITPVRGKPAHGKGWVETKSIACNAAGDCHFRYQFGKVIWVNHKI
jgi:hypothetical protein